MDTLPQHEEKHDTHRVLARFSGFVLLIPCLLLSSFAELPGPVPPQTDPTPTRAPVPPADPVKMAERIAVLDMDQAMVATNHIRPVGLAMLDIKGHTPLMWAATHGHTELVEELLDAGADVHAKNWWGQTALSMAIYHCHRETVNVLIEHNADISS